MPVADWTVPFNLASVVYGNNPSPNWSTYLTLADPLPINSAVVFNSGTGYYLLRPDGCSLTNVVRSTKDFVPQEDGAILHRRFTGGMEMTLAIQFWRDKSAPACDQLLQEMLDTMMGYLYGLLNSGDNQGRIRWVPSGGSSSLSTYRMLDDIRLLSYPTVSQQSGLPVELAVTVDCDLPYAQDETQDNPSITGGATIVNLGNRPMYPVWQVAASSFIIDNGTDSLSFDDTLLPSGVGGDYVEIDTFRNTVSIVRSPTVIDNAIAGLNMTTSDFFLLLPGNNTIGLSSGTGLVLTNGAWA
jgi:hypothetical protein